MRKIMIAFAVVAGCLTIACTNEQKPAKTTENAVAANEELVLDTAMMEDVMAVFNAVNEVIDEMSDEEIIEMLDSSMMEMNNELPKEVAAGMTITKVDYSDKTITFFTEIDEQQIEIGDVTEEDMTKVMKEGILEDEEDPSKAVFLALCRRGETNIAFNYLFKPSEKEMKAVLKHGEY
jgi:hypothetical protein